MSEKLEENELNEGEYGSQAQTERTITHLEIAELENPFKEVLESPELRRRIEAGEYGAIVGDDASGRIPTLIARKLIEMIYREKKALSPLTKFVAGSGGLFIYKDDPGRSIEGREYIKKYQEKQRMLSEWAERLKKELATKSKDKNHATNKVLVVTEYVGTGDGMAPLSKALSDAGLSHDFFMLCNDGDSPFTKSIRKKLNGDLFFGTEGVPRIYNQPHGGVVKEIEDLHATRVQEPDNGVESNKYFTDLTRESREDAKKLSVRLFEWYREKFLR